MTSPSPILGEGSRTRLLDDRSIVLLDVDSGDLDATLEVVGREIATAYDLSPEQLAAVEASLRRHGDAGPEVLEDGVAIVHDQLRGISVPPIVALVRTAEPLVLGPADELPTRFLWVLLSIDATHPRVGAAAEFAHLMAYEGFRDEALAAESPDALVDAFERALDDDVHFHAERIPPELQATGRLFGGVINDLKRRLPIYVKDWRDGLNVKVLASILFMFFACLAPAVAFGGLLSTLTGGQIGAVETVLASAVCGILWSVFAGQPLAIVGATGPNVIFTGILFTLCVRFDVPFLPTVAWTGLWAGLFMVILAALDASALIRYFTRFSDEIFAGLIAMIYISEAVYDLMDVFTDPQATDAKALLSLLLAVGTFGVAISLSRFRRSPYLRPKVREFLSDFGPTIAIVLMTGVAFSMGSVDIDTLAVPDTFEPTADRAWFVNPLDAPTWVWGATALPAMLLTILIWTNQNITARLANSPDYKLDKGPAFHYDIMVMGGLVALMGLFGLPWVVGAVIRSLNHVKSLAVEEGGKIVGVMENRLSGFGIHVLLLAGLVLFLPLLGMVPMAVLFGMFLFMGFGTLGGNQFVDRMKLWIMDPERYPPTHYMRAVPTGVVHAFTGVQLVCLAVLWFVKASPIGILFPFFIAMLVPVRMLLGRYFRPEDLALLDAEEVPADEEFREVGV